MHVLYMLLFAQVVETYLLHKYWNMAVPVNLMMNTILLSAVHNA